MRKIMLFAVPVIALSVAGTGCATKKFVRTTVGEVDTKVETLSKSVEENQERTRQNEGKIGEVDQRAAAAAAAASAADQKAGVAQQSAQEARMAADKAGTKAEEVDRASRRLVYEVVLSEDKGNFKFGKAALPDATKGEIDQLVQKLQADPKGYYLEIEGHTDNVGTKEVNEKIGEARAQEVKRYLYEQHQIPLHKMNVISYGEAKPAAPNNTRTGRAQNRRVVIRVLA